MRSWLFVLFAETLFRGEILKNINIHTLKFIYAIRTFPEVVQSMQYILIVYLNVISIPDSSILYGT